MRLVVAAVMLALVAVLAPVGLHCADHPTSPRKVSSQGQEPVEKTPKKDEPRKIGEKIAARLTSPRRSARCREARPLALAPQPPSTTEPADLGDARRAEHLRLLARPVVLQVFRH